MNWIVAAIAVVTAVDLPQRARQMQQAEVHDDCIELPCIERQGLGVAFAKCD